MSLLHGAHQGSPYRMDRRRRRWKGNSRLPSGSWRFDTISNNAVLLSKLFPNTAPDGLAHRLRTTDQSGALELQETAGELSRECHRVTALRTTWLRYKSRAGTCNATPGIFASKVCLPSGTPVADSADLIANDLKVVDEAAAPRTSRVWRREGNNHGAGGHSNHHGTVRCHAWKCDEACNTDVTPRRLKIYIVSTAKRRGDVVNMRAVARCYHLGLEPLFEFL